MRFVLCWLTIFWGQGEDSPFAAIRSANTPLPPRPIAIPPHYNSRAGPMKKIIKLALFGMLSLPVCCSQAFADSCDKIGTNATWSQNLKLANDALNAKDYNKALEISRELYEICPRAPYLNFIIGKSLMETGERTKGVMYLQKASDYTSQFVVDPELQRVIWYERYEAEHPERKESALNSLNDMNKQLQEENAKILQENIDLKDKDQLKNNIVMWTGVGIGGAGILMTILGGVLGFQKHAYDMGTPTDEYINNHPDTEKEKLEAYRIKNSYVTGWAMFGAGLAMMAAGGAMTGIGAYYYIKNKKDKSPIDFSMSPTSIDLKFTF